MRTCSSIKLKSHTVLQPKPKRWTKGQSHWRLKVKNSRQETKPKRSAGGSGSNQGKDKKHNRRQTRSRRNISQPTLLFFTRREKTQIRNKLQNRVSDSGRLAGHREKLSDGIISFKAQGVTSDALIEIRAQATNAMASKCENAYALIDEYESFSQWRENLRSSRWFFKT